MPVRLQIVRATRGSSKHLFEGDEPSVEPFETLEREIDWSSFTGRGSSLAEYRVVYRFDNSGGEYQTVDFPIEVKVRRTLQARAALGPPTIDGELSDWSEASWQTIGDRSQASVGVDSWEGPEDLSAQFSVMEDDENIYVAVRVADDTVALSDIRPDKANDGDCVELYVADPDQREISFNGEADCLGLILSPFPQPGSGDPATTAGAARVVKIDYPSIWGGGPRTQEFNSAQAAFVRQPRQYAIEIALPRSVVGWQDAGDSTHRIDVAINDRDTGGRRESQLAWAGTERNFYSSRYYGILRLPTQ